MRAATAPLVVLFIFAAATMPTVQSFSCGTNGATCNGLVGYITPNSTSLSEIASLFGIDDLNSLLGANNLSVSPSDSQRLDANKTINIPFPCICTNGTGRPRDPPVYRVVKGDYLSHIATDVFSGVVKWEEIQEFNNIINASLIEPGQNLKIPLPCSCDEVGGEKVVHYGYVVQPGQTVHEIAQQFQTSERSLLQLNGLASSKEALLAGVCIDVPLKACTSNVSGKSLDYPLLVSDGTTAFTAGNCVMCSCNAPTNNWTLNCQPSYLTSSIWDTCPSMKCEASAEALYLGTTTSLGCNRNTCAYAGYTSTKILTVLSSDYACPGNNDSGAKLRVQGWSWSLLLVLLCLGLIQ
ncbi:hypothetical protein NMG60_11015892 [Bertholletia excelsa]